MGFERIEIRQWRKGDSVVWGIVGGIHVIGMIMPAEMASLSRYGGFNSLWMWGKVLGAHAASISLPFDAIRYWNYSSHIPGDLIGLLQIAVMLVVSEWCLIFAYLVFFLKRLRRWARVADRLLLGCAVLNGAIVLLVVPLARELTRLSFSGSGTINLKTAINDWLAELFTLINAGLVTWTVSFVAAAIGSTVLRRYHQKMSDDSPSSGVR